MLTITPTDIPNGFPKWKASAIIDDAVAIFVPAALHPSGENVALFAALHDAVTIMQHCNHAFLPLHWLMEECPDDMDTWVAIKAMIQRQGSGGISP